MASSSAVMLNFLLFTICKPLPSAVDDDDGGAVSWPFPLAAQQGRRRWSGRTGNDIASAEDDPVRRQKNFPKDKQTV